MCFFENVRPLRFCVELNFASKIIGRNLFIVNFARNFKIKMANILAIRFSALGDIVMTIPALCSFAKRYPQDHVTLLSRSYVAPLFSLSLPENIHFRGVNLDNYKGLAGLTHLYGELRSEGYDAVADLHDVLRTMFLRFMFSQQGLPVAVIDKGRSEKRHLVSGKDKEHRPLTSSVERYALTFAELGYPFTVERPQLFPQSGGDVTAFLPVTGVKGTDRWIGVAPFAQHEGKIYPLERMARVIDLLQAHSGVKIFLFGAGSRERGWCGALQDKYSGKVVSMVGRSGLAQELALMSHLDVMLTMDSANMHLASLAGVPVVALWGATHPDMGFSGLQMPGSVNLQADMDCRPCSIFGNKKCSRPVAYECMLRLEPDLIAMTVMNVADKKKQQSKRNEEV